MLLNSLPMAVRVKVPLMVCLSGEPTRAPAAHRFPECRVSPDTGDHRRGIGVASFRAQTRTPDGTLKELKGL